MLNRTVITAITFKLYVYYGVEKTTFKDVASALGVTSSSLYSYFANKGELIMAVLKKMMDTEHRLIKRRSRSVESFPEVLSCLLAVKLFIFKKNNRLFHAKEHLISLGYNKQLTDMRERFAKVISEDLCSSGISDYGENTIALKTKLKDFLLQTDQIFMEYAKIKTENGVTTPFGMNEISNLLDDKKCNLLYEINLTPNESRKITGN